MDITLQAGDTFAVTGVTVHGKRFKIQTSNAMHAMCINLWRGSVWLCRGGKRMRVKHVVN